MGWQDDELISPAAQPAKTGAAWEQDEVIAPAPPSPAAVAQPQSQQPSIASIGTNLASGANRGLMAVAGMPIDALSNLADLGIAAYGAARGPDANGDVPPLLDRSQILGSSEWIRNKFAPTGIGVQVGDSAPDRYAGIVGQGLAGAALTPQNALSGALRGVAGNVAGNAAYEQTHDPAAAAAASLLAGGAPEAGKAVVRGAIRGGEAGRQRVAENIDAFQRSGSMPSVGQATERPVWRAVESVLSKIPGGAGIMASRAETRQAELGAGADRIASNLAPGATASRSGSQIERGITETFLPDARAKQAQLYKVLDAKIAPQSNVPVTNTIAALDKVSQGIANAPTVSGTKLVKNGLAEELRDAIKADAPYGALPYEALKAMRTRIGEKLESFDMAPDVPRQQLKQIYAGLTEDMKVAAAINGPEATAALQRANNYTRGLHDRIDSLQSVIDKAGGPEKIFQAATAGTGEGATTLRTVMKSLPAPAQATLASSVVRRLGRATPGNQNDVGDQFSTQTFLTNWAKLSPEAKGTLTAPFGPKFKADMEALAKVANNLKQGAKVYANPSGTSAAAASIGAASGAASALMSGHPGGAVVIGGGIAAANGLARIVNNKEFVLALSRATKLSPQAVVGQLTALKDGQQEQND